MSKKRHRERTAIDTQLVEIYEDLANEDESIRLKAAHTLLTKFGVGHRNDSEQLNGILRRLFRGLCSGRKAARVGFSIALTEFLTQLFGPPRRDETAFQDATGILQKLKEQTTATNGTSGQEGRDYLLGRLFGAEAIIQSGVLFQHAEGASAWRELLDIVLEMATKKPWLREECGYMLYTTIQGSMLPDHEPQYAESIVQKIQFHGLAKTPEGVAVWVAVNAKYPSMALPSGVWHKGDPLNRKEQFKLAQILKEAGPASSAQAEDDQKTAETGQWNAKVHFAWHAVLSQLLGTSSTKHQENSSKPSSRITIEQFWDECVDNNLFGGSSSVERKYWGFLLVQKTLPEMPSSQISSIFGQNFMRCFMNQLASPDRYLHRAAERTRKTIIDKAKREPEMVISILTTLLTPPKGDINFDSATRTKTIDTLLSLATSSGLLDDFVSVADNLILRPNTKDDKLAQSRRQALADQLVALLRSSQNQSGSESSVYIASILSVLAKYAYFEVGSFTESKCPEPAISPKAREMFRSRLSSGFSHLISIKSVNSSHFANSLVCDICHPDPSYAHGQLLLDVDERVQGLLDRALESLSYAKEKSNNGPMYDRATQAATLMLSLAILQVHNGNVDAVSLLEELTDLYNEKQLEPSGSISAQTTTALVGILLSLISKPSQLFRRLSQQVFAAFTGHIDAIGLQTMLNVLDAKESLVGQAEIFDQQDDEVGGSDASDVEEVDLAEGISASANQDSGADTESDGTDTSTRGDDDLVEGPDEELAAFDAKLAQALGTRPGQADVGEEGSSLSDEDMDDEQMESLDEHLESIFRERKKATSKKTDKKDAKETMINFKCRVLELLEIYVKNEHCSNLALHLLLPILCLIRTTSSPLVARKACDLIREYARLCKGNSLPQIADPASALDLLGKVHDEAGQEASNAHASACSQASLLLVRVLVGRDRNQLRRIIHVYANTQEKALFDPKFTVKTSLFTDWLNWCNSFKK